MNFLSHAADRAKRFYAALTPRARLTTWALAAVLVVGIVFLLSRGLGSSKSYLLGGRSFDAAEIAAAQTSFAKAKLPAARVEGDRLCVPLEQEPAYVAALADGGALPADFHDYLDETLTDLGPFMGGKQREELIKNAKQRELANIIRRLPGIQAAAVHYDRYRESGLTRRETMTASVTVWPDSADPLDARRLQSIRKLVASAIAGLKLENVAVTDANGGDAGDGMDSEHNSYIAAMRLHQKDIREQVLSVLPHIDGVRVAVNVEIDPQLDQTMEPKEVTEAAAHVAREGSSAKTPGDGPGRQFTQTRHVGLTPRRVTVAAAIPRSHFTAIWRSRQAQRKSESPPASELEALETSEIATYEELVRLAIPSGEGAAPDKLVKIAAYDRVDPLPLEEPVLAGGWLAWLGRNWQTLGMFGLAIGGLVVLRTFVKAALTPRSPADGQHFGQHDHPSAASAEHSAQTIEDELQDIIRHDPDAAANVLKLWMADSA